MAEPTWDVVIVGAGTAGCLLANRLSADPSCRVLLLEAGGRDDYLWIHIPVGYLHCIGNPRTDWMYRTDPQPGLNGRQLIYPRGKVLGGCSSINGMVYMRGQRRDYDGWGAGDGHGPNPGWSWDECLPYFRRHEDHHAGASAWHGAGPPDPRGREPGGEWRVERQRLHWPLLDAVAEAAVQAGLPRTDDFNRGNNEGVGYFEVNQKAGWRWSTSKAFLRPVRHRPNLQVWTDAHVTRVLFEGAGDTLRAVGVELRRGAHETLRLRVARELVLAAGAVNTPLLLQRSGLGPGELLAAHGVAPVLERAGVGANLQDHLQIRAVFAVEGVRTLNSISHSAWGRLRIGLQYALWRRGPMSMSPSQLGAFAKSSPDLAWPDLELHVQPLSLDAFGQPLHREDAFTASVCNLEPKSRGHVRITGPRAEDRPSIAPGYLSDPADRLVAAQSLRLVRRLAAQPALARYRPRELKPGVQYDSDEDLARLAGEIGTTIFHPVGTCKMGPAADPAAVVDARLRVHGVHGLRVVDASVMPAITHGNTNAPTLMLAERAAAWMQEDSRG